jgi:hypothetical protein
MILQSNDFQHTPIAWLSFCYKLVPGVQLTQFRCNSHSANNNMKVVNILTNFQLSGCNQWYFQIFVFALLVAVAAASTYPAYPAYPAPAYPKTYDYVS